MSRHTLTFFFLRISSDRKSTRLNSSHDDISYAVFCLIKNPAIGDLGCVEVTSVRANHPIRNASPPQRSIDLVVGIYDFFLMVGGAPKHPLSPRADSLPF